MPIEPVGKRVVAFVDGQNLFYAAKRAFGYPRPEYDPRLLAEHVVKAKPDWRLTEVRFYTGVHKADVNPFWHHYWMAKLAVMGTRGIQSYSRPLRYQQQQVTVADGSTVTVLLGQEKGIDVRIALDMVRIARSNEADVLLLFSQDQDLSEAADEVRAISRQQDRWIRVVSAFPRGSHYARGVNNTEWFTLNQAAYDACLDPNDYRPRP